MSNDYHDPARKGGSIQTYTGIIFFPMDPRVEDIELIDVAHALSNKARFTGHTRKFYSTCEHSLRVSNHLESQGACLMDQYIGLHHDDSDAYLPDIPTPLKYLPEFAWFREIEKKVEAVCYEKFGCVVTDYSVIKNSDVVLLLTEKRDLMPVRNGDWKHAYSQEAIPPPYYIEPFGPEDARALYLKRHHELLSKLKDNPMTAPLVNFVDPETNYTFEGSRYYRVDPNHRMNRTSEEELDSIPYSTPR